MSNSDTTGVVADENWWKEAVFYQIYPRSFNDTDGDGVGDLGGIRAKVDYLDYLGVDCVWLNPIYASPGVDNGYDIADYRTIDPTIGDMDQWERLLEELHNHDIRLIMDLVINHTSDQHMWFQQSRDETEPYADYYYWQSEPNNWESHFEDSAWSYDEKREAYYLHLFADAQPDLNWENPTVRDELYDIVSWWLERGIDGFRMDVINVISKAHGLPDGDPETPSLTGSEHFINGPRMHEYFNELADDGLDSYKNDIVTVGECAEIDPKTAVDVTGRKSDALDMTIFFEHMGLDRNEGWESCKWSLSELKSIMQKWQESTEDGAWLSLYHSNHDQPRGLSRFGDEEYRYRSATMVATWLHGHRGSPFVYQGEEIGMSNVSFESPAQLRDVWAKNFWKRQERAGKDFEQVRDRIEEFSRDNARTPMQWNDESNAGFSDSEPWIDVADDYETVNVAAQRGAERSVLEYYRKLIRLRDEDDVITYGDFELLAPEHEQVYAIKRSLQSADYTLLIICNFAAEPLTFEPPLSVDLAAEDVTVALGNEPDPALPPTFELRPYESAIYRLHD